MNSIINSQPPSISMLPRVYLKHHFTTAKLLWLSKSSNSEANNSGFMHLHTDRIYALPTRVATATLFLSATSPPNSGDFSVLFQTSAVMLFVYWIANFVVPELILKDLQRDNTNEETNRDEENLSDNRQESALGNTSSSGQKRGFDSTKQ